MDFVVGLWRFGVCHCLGPWYGGLGYDKGANVGEFNHRIWGHDDDDEDDDHHDDQSIYKNAR